MVEGGVTIVKYLLFLANLVLWCGGLFLIIVGSIMQLKFAGVLDILGDERLATPVILLVMGSLCTLLGFLGCCGAIRENYCLTVSFAVLLALVIACETAMVIIAYALHDNFREGITNQLQTGLLRYNRSSGVQQAWDRAQQVLECCGATNSSDWASLGSVPDSCCVVAMEGCARENAPLHGVGCIEKVEAWVMFNSEIVGGASAVLAALQVLGVCFACCLSKSILKDFHDFYY
ncbi:unnamed protein product [Caenorhabditis auriculariae]|uniref:Tetraspanin n=1 Tax=Caenorhabditis auriculariae TaxID=2777116 RepID=A0A8S1H6B4_9PELO|nr:unnamed protein product [Caenorhabditis auriculariae]